jgi:LPS-assembly lipoprotein
MWWSDIRLIWPRLARLLSLAPVLAAAGMLAGCFQPVYGERSLTGGPGIRTALSSIDVTQIPAGNGSPESRVAVDLRNQLIFNLNGNDPTAPTHRLDVKISTTRLSVIVDLTSARPEVENYGIIATYNLVELKTGRVAISDQTFSRVSYDAPGQQQRFARVRALRDAENRAVQVIADNIRNRLASYFVAGT